MKNESKPQRTSICVTKRVFSVIAVIAVLASIVCIFALNQLVQPMGIGTYTLLSSGSLPTITLTVNSGQAYATANMESGGYLYVYVMNDSNNSNITYSVSPANNSTSYNKVVDDVTYYYTKYSIGRWGSYWPTDDTCAIPHYAVAEDFAINKLIEMYQENHPINPPEPPLSSYSLNVSLPAGNILIADISNTGSNTYYLETTGGTSGAVVKPGMNNIQIGYVNSIPTSFSVPNSLWDYPSWSGSGKSSVFGTYNRQSTQGDFAISNTNAMKYVIITNPMYPNDNNASANRLNSDLSITIDKVNSYVIYSLQTGYVSGNLIGTNDGSQYIDYQYDENTDEWVGVNQDGDPASPVWGGQNDFENTPTTINDWLENIAHQISSFFSGAIGAIATLSVAVKNFAGTLMSLYVWLPSPVLSILSSAVMLAIVIGVIKVFI